MFIHPQWGYSCKLIKVGTGRETGVSWKNKQYLVLLFLNPSVWDAELEESLNSRPAQSTYRLTGQPALHRKTKGTGWVGAPLLASQPSLYLVSRFKKIYIFIYLFWFFETRFLCVALAALELSLQTRLALIRYRLASASQVLGSKALESHGDQVDNSYPGSCGICL